MKTVAESGDDTRLAILLSPGWRFPQAPMKPWHQRICIAQDACEIR